MHENSYSAGPHDVRLQNATNIAYILYTRSYSYIYITIDAWVDGEYTCANTCIRPSHNAASNSVNGSQYCSKKDSAMEDAYCLLNDLKGVLADFGDPGGTFYGETDIVKPTPLLQLFSLKSDKQKGMQATLKCEQLSMHLVQYLLPLAPMSMHSTVHGYISCRNVFL